MYQLNIRMGEFIARSGGGEQDKAAIREMMKRALQQQQQQGIGAREGGEEE